MSIKALILDCDGVLCDAAPIHHQALNHALLVAGLEPIGDRDHVETYNGLPTKRKLEMMGIRDKETIDKVFREKQFQTALAINQLIKPREDVVKTLLYWKSKGLKLACTSNSIRSTLSLMLERTGVLHLLDAVVSNEDVVSPKPSPIPYLTTCKILGVQPGEAVVVEDSHHGRVSALAAGCILCPINQPSELTHELLWSYLA